MTIARIVKTPDGTTRCRIRVDPPLCVRCLGVYGRLKDVEHCATCKHKADEIAARILNDLFPHTTH